MKAMQSCFPLVLVFLLLLQATQRCSAEVKASAEDGFAIVIEETTQLNPARTFSALVGDFSQWYDAAHSYSGDSENLSMDLQKSCMYEKLPQGGFVRHMEIVYYQPDKRTLRLTGGLGPLQSMGVNGALTFSIVEVEGATVIRLMYNVSGSGVQKLDRLAPPVDQVLNAQVQALKKYCDQLK